MKTFLVLHTLFEDVSSGSRFEIIMRANGSLADLSNAIGKGKPRTITRVNLQDASDPVMIG